MERILVIRMSAFGDVIHALPAVMALRRGYPRARLSWLLRPEWKPLLEGNPAVDEVVEAPRRSLRLLAALRRARFDLVVDFQGLLQSAVLGRAAAGACFGFAAPRERLAALLYRTRVRAEAGHIVERNLELAYAAGGKKGELAFPLPPGSPEGRLPDRFVLACPLAGWGSKQWPLERFSALADRLAAAGVPLVVNGPPGAAARLAEVRGAVAHCSGIPGLVNATRRAAAVVGVDSGPLHLAAALGKPGVAIYGPTDPARNGPYGGTIRVLRAPGAPTTYRRQAEPGESMRAIGVEEVWAVLRPLL
jgi:heptosyltransferase-1